MPCLLNATCFRGATQNNFGRKTRVRFQEFPHEFECFFVFPERIRGRAIRRHDQFEVTHVGVIRGEEHAEVTRNASQDELLRSQISEQRFQRGGEKTGVFRF